MGASRGADGGGVRRRWAVAVELEGLAACRNIPPKLSAETMCGRAARRRFAVCAKNIVVRIKLQGCLVSDDVERLYITLRNVIRIPLWEEFMTCFLWTPPTVALKPSECLRIHTVSVSDVLS